MAPSTDIKRAEYSAATVSHPEFTLTKPLRQLLRQRRCASSFCSLHSSTSSLNRHRRRQDLHTGYTQQRRPLLSVSRSWKASRSDTTYKTTRKKLVRKLKMELEGGCQVELTSLAASQYGLSSSRAMALCSSGPSHNG
eukprot:6173442-Pleurochrysis_carterae.AAC.1